MDTLEILNFSNFFSISSSLEPPGCTEQKFYQKVTSKHVENVFEHFRERFLAFWKKTKVFPFFFSFSKFRPSRMHWAFFSRNLPRNKFKTCLDNSGKVFRGFESSNVFPFFEIFDISTLQGALAKKFRKNYFKTSLDTLGISFGHLWKIENFSILWIFFESPGCTGQSFSPSKKSIKTCSKNVFGNVFGHVLKVQCLSSFPKFFQVSTLRGALAFFSQNKIPQSKFRTCLDTIRNSFGHLKNIEIFQFFSIFFSQTSRVHWAKILAKTWSRNMFKACLIAFRNVFWAFWKIEMFSCFLKFYQVSTLQGALGIFFQESHLKTSSTTCLDTFRNVFGHFWNFKFFEFFL